MEQRKEIEDYLFHHGEEKKEKMLHGEKKKQNKWAEIFETLKKHSVAKFIKK